MIKHCFVCHIVAKILNNIVEPESGVTIQNNILATWNNVGSQTLFNVVFIKPEQVVHFLLWIVKNRL